MSLASTFPPAATRTPLEAARREYYKCTGYDILSSDAARAAGLAHDASPTDIHAALQMILASICLQQNTLLDTVLANVLDVLLVFSEIGGEVVGATVSQYYFRQHNANYCPQKVPGGQGLFIAFGIFLKVRQSSALVLT